MSRIAVVFEDNDDGTVNIKAEFEPELTLDESATPAQLTALEAIRSVTETGEIDE